ncbi:hypothetical protein [Ruegeria lacuscaerulensis]|uniref:hypothetical protein n=1 Tax=Ruegeria lacuscaerulensis TaxID=55218 RepID=UPI0014801B8A|nr:hypothetical protein [Ruegeria lacuscaerulensis]
MNSIANRTFLISHSFVSTLCVCFTLMFTGQLHADAGANTPPNCVTNIDAEGTVIAGFFGLVTPPVPYSSIETEGGDLTVYPTIRHGNGALVYAGIYRGVYSAGGASQTVNKSGTETELVFKQDDGSIVHICMVKANQFDPTIYDPIASQVGECDLKQIAGVETLTPGHVQIFEPPYDLVEISGVPKTVLAVAPVTTELIQLRGQTPGWANYVWHPEDQSKFGGIGGICNVEVSKSTSTTQDYQTELIESCKDTEGKNLTLGQGSKAQLELSKYRNNINFSSGRFTQNLPPIEINTPLKIGLTDVEEFEVIASRPGKMSLVRRVYLSEERKLKHDVCMVTVN